MSYAEMSYVELAKAAAREVALLTLEMMAEKGSEMVDEFQDAGHTTPLDWFKFFYGDDPASHSEMVARRQKVYEKLSRVQQAVPALGNHKTRCPHDGCEYQTSIFNLVILLNDTHEWSRQEIADWLETLDADLTFPTPDEGGDVDEHAGHTN